MDFPATVDEIIERERACGVLYGPYWQAKYLARAPERVRKDLELASRFPGIMAMRKAQETDFVPSAVAPGVFSPGFPFTNTATVTAASETDLWAPALWTPVPANDAAVGSLYRVSFGGIYSNRTTNSPTSLWTPRWGQGGSGTGTALGASSATYSGGALTNAPFYGEFEIGFRTIGSSGTATGNGFVMRGGLGALNTVRQPMGGTVATIDTTAAGGLKVAHTWSEANASNTLTVRWVYLRSVN